MGICEYCGKDAGLLRNSHKECRDRHDAGKLEIRNIVAESAISATGPEIVERVAALAKASYVNAAQAKTQIVSGWEDAVSKALGDRVLSVNDENALVAAKEAFGLSQSDVDGSGAFARIVKAAVIRELTEGRIPKKMTIDGPVPFNLQKNEQIVWLFKGVKYWEERTRTEYRGAYGGVSIRIVKGVYYRTGSFRGSPLVTTNLSPVDVGMLAVTEKHIYFAGRRKAFRVPYNKIVAFKPYNNGIGIQRDAQSAKPQVFEVSDGWFINNIVGNLANLAKA